MKKVAVVILNWNGEKMLQTYLPSVISNTDHNIADIIVADNGSDDNSLAMLKKEFPSVKVIALDKNYGFAEGYNRALAKCKAEYFVLLNSDIEVTPGWLEPLIYEMDKSSDIAAAQPKIKALLDKERFEYAGAAGGYLDKYGFPFCRGRVIATNEIDNGQYDTSASVMWATGACLVVRSYIFNKVGRLDARFFAHMEEIDLCWRMKNQGYKIMSYPQSTVYHLGGGTLSTDSPRKLFLNYRNNLLLLYKNLPRKKLKRIMVTRWIIDIMSAFVFILQGKPKSAIQVPKAHISFQRMRPSYKSVRRKLEAQRTINHHEEVYSGSIIWQYFVKRNKHFNHLKGFETLFN